MVDTRVEEEQAQPLFFPSAAQWVQASIGAVALATFQDKTWQQVSATKKNTF